MSLKELKSEIGNLSPEERLHLKAYLAELTRPSSESESEELGDIMRAMDSGNKASKEQVLEVHRGLGASGR
jgi:hypothetical protein